MFRLTAVSTLVVLALTGFSSGRGHGSGSHSGGGGGGCSSSRQDHDSSSSTSGGSSGGSHYRDYDDDDSTGSTGGGSSSSGSSTRTSVVQDARVSLVECATRKKPYATVKITNPNSTLDRFEITVRFLDASGAVVAAPLTNELVSGRKTEDVRILVGDAALAAKVARCEVRATAPAV
ncbi:hypothetical protein IAG44_23420 [Streptomyces roseirectus]|uniref:Uncharacterized protein n=1 Tax=Streptomyces roseirectus TaxID=2768066 RepID=A0A7H0IT02_9ACTN|nr:hypothetical protein IAG44_23420 [Streptomyces roseirectus]